MLVEKYAERLVALGFKVGQVDQTETPLMLAEANKKAGGKKRVCVNRELSQVMTPGTIVDSDILNSAEANYLFALVERPLEQSEMDEEKQQAEAKLERDNAGSAPEELNLFVVEFGFAYVDCTTGGASLAHSLT